MLIGFIFHTLELRMNLFYFFTVLPFYFYSPLFAKREAAGR